MIKSNENQVRLIAQFDGQLWFMLLLLSCLRQFLHKIKNKNTVYKSTEK